VSSQRNSILILCLLGLALTACTRAQQDEGSKVQISLPQKMISSKLSAQSGVDILAHVAINVTGEGIRDPIVFNWDLHEESSTSTIPGQFTLDVPSGSNRLIQVLGVYKNSVSSQMTFYYGDKTESFSVPEPPGVNIAISQIGSGSTITTGRVSGRYLTSANSGPTSLVDIKFKPGNGNPALIVDSGSIVNGWFSFFMLSGANFQYVMRRTGELLWEQEVSLESTMFDPGQSAGAFFDQRVKAFVPVHTTVDNRNNSLQYYSQEPEIYVWGYWGPGATGKKVCTSGIESSPATLKIKKYASSNLGAAPALTITHLISPGDPTPTIAALWDQGAPMGSLKVKGGLNVSSGLCGGFADIPANQFLNFQKVTLNLLDGPGNDSVAGFKGLFRLDASNQPFSISGDPKTITGQVLPGITSEINELRLYKRVGTEELRLDSPDCFRIAAGLTDFIPAGSTTITAAGGFSLVSNISAAEGASGVSGVLCPVAFGTVAPLGSFIQNWAFGNSFTPPTLANSYQVQGHPFGIATSQCHHATLRMLDGATNYNVYNDTTRTFTVDLTGVTGVIFPDSTCSGGSASLSVDLNVGETFKEIYYSVSGGTTGGLRASIGSFGPASQQAAISVSGTLSPSVLVPSQPAAFLSPGECRSMEMYVLDLNSRTTAASGDVTFSSVGGAIGVYSDSACSAAMPTTTLSMEFARNFYLKRLSGSGENTVSLNHDGALTDTSVVVDPVQLADHLKIQHPFALASNAYFAKGECIPFQVEAHTAGNVVPGGTPGMVMNVDVETSSGLFFASEASCDNTSGSTSKAATTIGSSFWQSNNFWYKNTSPGTYSLGVPHSPFRISNPGANIALSKTLVANNPSHLPGIYGWFKMNPFYDQASGNSVGGWATAFGTSMPALTPSTAPTLSSFGGPWRSVEFSGMAKMGASISLSTSFTVALRVRFANAIGTEEGIFQITGGSCDLMSSACVVSRSALGQIKFFGQTSAATISDTDWHTIVVTRSGSSIYVHLDGNATPIINYGGLSPPYTSSFISSSNFILGAVTEDNYATRKPLNGNVGDIIIYSQDQSSNQATLHTYLASKFP